MASKRKVSAATRVKLSQAAKNRRRGPKGSPLGGKFLTGLSFSMHGGHGRLALSDEFGKKKDSTEHLGPREGFRRTKHNFPEGEREKGVSNRSDAERLVRGQPEKAIEELTYRRTRDQTGSSDLARHQIEHAPVRVSQASQTEVLKAEREKTWKEPGTFKRGQKKPPGEFMKELDTTAPTMKGQIDDLLGDPNSVFMRAPKDLPPGTKPATHGGKVPPYARRRLQQYTDARQEGLSHDEALNRVESARQGRRPSKTTAARRTGREGAASRKVRTRKGKYESGTPKPNDFQFGISASHIDKLSELRSNLPDASESDVIRMQQTQRESIFAELQKNQKWAHETRRANVLNDQGGKMKEDDDRVVFFTTNLGAPAPSVPSDSLIGQYVIRKRVQMMKAAGIPKSQLNGKFPEAVRDMHLFEMSTGLQYAVEGRQGAYKQTGWRYRNKSHGGYGKPVPVGSQIVYDSQGAPVYDPKGNIMYTEGATRPFRVNTPLAGLRIFIG